MSHNPAIADAFGKSKSGMLLVIETKEIGPRVKEIKELFHCTFVEMPRTTRYYYKRFYELMDERKRAGKTVAESPFALFKAAKPVLKKIAGRGGNEFKSALSDVQFTWSSKKTLNATVEMILG